MLPRCFPRIVILPLSCWCPLPQLIPLGSLLNLVTCRRPLPSVIGFNCLKGSLFPSALPSSRSNSRRPLWCLSFPQKCVVQLPCPRIFISCIVHHLWYRCWTCLLGPRKLHMSVLPPPRNCALLSHCKTKAPSVSLHPRSFPPTDSGLWASKGKPKMWDDKSAQSWVAYKKIFLTFVAIPPMKIEPESVGDPAPDPIVTRAMLGVIPGFFPGSSEKNPTAGSFLLRSKKDLLEIIGFFPEELE
ncbi:hypothetical protein CJ030_MR6G013204 [Morella rubra]|uniref:Uncharacterized protein n=1 Tax=Morella rubra TaxID=262757 RepID=A0A6A1VAI3_9ROSI|nr:hypothetical protein CJ030_MR6G013204 [Morella rubra]